MTATILIMKASAFKANVGRNLSSKLSWTMLALVFPIILSILLATTNAQVIHKFPEVFQDSKHLPRNKLEGDNYELIGHVRKLDTYANPQDVKKIETRFSIVNRFMRTDDLVFKHDKQFVFNSEDDKTINYPLDLRKMIMSRFDPEKRTVVIMPGFLSNDIAEEPWLEKMKETWLLLEDMNVILVSWRANNRFMYDRAVANTPFVGRQISIFLYYLATLMGKSLFDEQFLKQIHFVGHSLGAHISAFVGKDMGGKLGRISGLDTAGPSFDKFPPELRLNFADALLVESFHTNAGRMRYLNFGGSSILKGFEVVAKSVPGVSRLARAIESSYSGEGDTAWYGIEDQVGHVDYYINDGRTQPGCTGLMHLCDHVRAHEVFQSFLNYELMVARAGKRSNEDRFLAFKANGSSEFAVGSNFRDKCPSLLAGSQSWSSDLHRKETFKRCSVPIDLVGNVDEVRRELGQEYGINFDNGTSNSKYFLKTRHQEAFVGDHYLLKIHLASDPIWTENCMFRANIVTQSGSKTIIKLNKQFDIIDHKSRYDFKGLAIPFIHPDGPVAHKDLNEIFSKLQIPSAKINQKFQPGGKVSKEQLEKEQEATINKTLDDAQFLIYTHVPQYVELSVSKSEATGIRETITGWFKRHRDSCELRIRAIEIQPISPNPHTFIATYGNFTQSKEQGVEIILYPRDELATVIQSRYKQLDDTNRRDHKIGADENDNDVNNKSKIPIYKLQRNGQLTLDVSEILMA